MRRRTPLIILLTLAMLSTLPGSFKGFTVARAQQSHGLRRKMPDFLLARARAARAGRGERVRVIFNVASDAAAARSRSVLERAGGRVSAQLNEVDMMVADVPVEKLEELAASNDVSWVSPEQEIRSLQSAQPDNTSHLEVTSGASKLLPSGNGELAKGGGGNGVGIAVLDSGISPPDAAEFAGYEWRRSSGTLGLGLFSQEYLASYDRIKKHIDFTGEGRTEDSYGHGTHTAGVAAGTGQASEQAASQRRSLPTYGGIATGAHLIDVRVLNSQGMGTVSNAIAGIDWVIKNRRTYNIRVMNLSLGTAVTQSYKTDPLCMAVGRAVDAGITVVVAAGNWGKDSQGNTIYGGILSPANSPKVITVGATNTQQTNQRSDDTVTTYSSRGPTLVDGLVKPDLVAPGNRIGAAETAASSPTASNSYTTSGGGGLLGTVISGDTSSSTPDATGTYRILSGTSFAAPAVSGTVALMLEANPSLTPRIVKAILMRTAQRLPFYERMVMDGQMHNFVRVITEGAGALNTSAARTLAKAIRKDANYAEPGDDLITARNTGYSTLDLDAPVAGEGVPLNNGIIWVDGVSFTERLRLTDGFRLADGQVLTDGFVIADGYLTSDASYVFSDGTMVANGVTIGTGVLISNGTTIGTGVLISNGITLGSGIMLGSQYACGDGSFASGAPSGWSFENEAAWASNLIDPQSAGMNEEAVLIQGETAIPAGVQRLAATSRLYPQRPN